MEIHKNYFISILILHFQIFITILSYLRLYYPYRSFNHSNWWRHKL